LAGKGDAEMLKALCSKTYKNQAIWFLNAFWHKLSDEAENFHKFTLKLASLDLQKGAEGCDLDEMNMHRFLEHFKEIMTVLEMRESLRSTGAISGNVKNFPVTYFYIFKYKVDWHVLVNASQGDNQKEVEEAQHKLNMVQEALKISETRSQEAKVAVREAESRETEAKAAQVELEAALKEVKSQEDAFNNKTADLQKKSSEGSVVSQNKAKNELAQHLASDPLPLRKAKITQEAAVKKADRATKAAADARASSIEAANKAEAAVEETQRKLEEAEAFLMEVKSKPGSAAGQIWWLERELHEARAYMPEKKGGYRKK